MKLKELKKINLQGGDKKIMKTKIKQEKGITLIALVVTIVVLLILAGVSLNAIFSDSGIIKKAQEAQNKMNEAQQKDLSSINELNTWLDNQVNETTGEGDSVIKIGNTTEYTVTSTGKILNWKYTNFLQELVEGITYTVEFTTQNTADWDINYTKNILTLTNVSALFEVPDVEVLVKASNGEEKIVQLTGGEIKQAQTFDYENLEKNNSNTNIRF